MSSAYRALHAVWRLLPHTVRRKAFHTVTHFFGPRPSALTSVTRGPVTVFGLLNSTTGLGEGARLCLQALATLGFHTNYFDVSPTFLTDDLPVRPDFGAMPTSGEGGVLIAHLNPHMLPLALMQLGRKRLQNKYTIGYWAWELERIPQKWVNGLQYIHEIWVPSEFTANAFRAVTDRPIRVVHHPVATPLPSSRSRAAFGLQSEQFVVLTMLHMGSGFVRKNPVAAIEAFRRAFGTDDRKIMIVKIADPDVYPSAYQTLKAAIGDASNIRLLDEKLSIGDQSALIACSDAVISLHRSEGFGLVLAQAMLLGKPTVATAWSGNMDFMHTENAALIDYTLVPVTDPQQNYTQSDQHWAEPDIAQAAEWLRRLADDPALRARLGSRAKADAALAFSHSAYAAIVRPALTPYTVRGSGTHSHP